MSKPLRDQFDYKLVAKGLASKLTDEELNELVEALAGDHNNSLLSFLAEERENR